MDACEHSRASYLLVEGPLEQRVAQTSHHHEEQGQVAAAARPVAVQVDTQTHLVAVLAGVERCRAEETQGGEGAIERPLSLKRTS